MKRASEVPPVVLSSGVRPVTCLTAAATRSLNGPGGVTKASPETFTRRSKRPPTPAQRSVSHVSTSPAVCRSLKRTLKRAWAWAGITFDVGLPTSTDVMVTVEGWKCSVPSSSGVPSMAASIRIRRGIGLSARCG